jgi:ASC-1-like (ASCH) protein
MPKVKAIAKTYYDIEQNLTKWGTDEYGQPNCIVRYIPNNSFSNKIKKGDLIVFNKSGKEEESYRNEDIYIWDGKNLKKQMSNAEAKPEGKTKAKLEAKAEAKPESKAEAKLEAKAKSVTYYDFEENLTKCGKDEYGQPNALEKYVPRDSFLNKIKKGDLIVFNESGEEEDRYRNEGVYIWNGKNLRNLDSVLDDYRHIPGDEFPVGDVYPVDYWTQIHDNKRYFMIAHNEIIHLEKKLYGKIEIKHDKKTNIFTGNVLIHDENVIVLFEDYTENIKSVKKLREFLATHPHMNFIEGTEIDKPNVIKCIIE